MKFRVERDALADAVTWAARSLATRPTIPVLAGLLLHGRRRPRSRSPASTSRPRPRSTSRSAPATPGQALVSGRLLADITKALPAAPGRRRRRRLAADDRVRLGPVHPADDAGRGLPAAARACRPPPARSTSGEFATAVAQVADRRRPRRHPADAHRRPARDRRRPAHPRRHRPLPAGRPRADLERRRPDRPSPSRCWCRPGRWPTPPRASATASTLTIALSSGGAGEGIIGFSGRPAAQRPPPGCSTRSSRPTARCCRPTGPRSAEVVGRPVRRGGQAGRAGRRPRHAGAAGVRRRRRRRCRPAARTRAGPRSSSRSTYDGEPITTAFNPQFLLDGLGALETGDGPAAVHLVEQAGGAASRTRRPTADATTPT